MGAQEAVAIPSFVPPQLPSDPRQRAARIGGGFGQRIGEALDLGLDGTTLMPLLDKLDPPAAPQPLGFGRALGSVAGGSSGFGMPGGRSRSTVSPRRSHAQGMDAKGMDAGAIATIVGTAVTIAAESSSGDVDWRLPAWEGKKNPPSGPAVPAPQPQQAVIALTGWPSAGGTYLNTLIRWHYDGTSIGPVYVEPGNYDDTIGWGITVTGTIQDDPRLYPRSPAAMAPGPDQVPSLTVVLTYQFQAPALADDPTAVSRVKLFADGTHEIDNEWIKAPSGMEGLEEIARYPRAPDQSRTSVPVFAG
jgi:hypothetical protein